MIVVSGCPRSGTSMMMRIMEHVYGEDRILGEKELDKAPEPPKEVELTEVEEYLRAKGQAAHKPGQNQDERRARARDMNPNGYYEMAFSVRGIFYMPAFEELLDADKRAKKKKIVKVVSQGLAQSDPRHVDKVVFMARNPRAVAKSQERLGRNNPMNPEDAPVVNGRRQLVRSVSMYNRVTPAAAYWLKEHPTIPVHIVDYDKLLEDPVPVIEALAEFMGEGDWSTAADMIDVNLRRSEPCTDDGPQWTYADEMHPLLLAGDWQGILDKAEEAFERAKAEYKGPHRWFCVRRNSRVNAAECKMCVTNANTRSNFRKNATRKNIDWKNEPCVFECQYDQSRETHLTIAESIENNFWVEDDVEDTATVQRNCSRKHCRLGNMECDKYWGCRDTCRIASKRITSMQACPKKEGPTQ